MASRPILRAVPAVPGGSLTLPAGEPAFGDPGLTALREEVADLREALFAAGDLARHALPFDQAGVHVALQAAAHQLGVAQGLLAHPD